MKGRNRGSRLHGDLPEDIQPGDYWRIGDGQDPSAPSYVEDEPSNLTKLWYYVAAPMPNGGYALGNLRKHTIREHDDGTISVRPGDGSSNSILVTRHRPDGDQSWHGYIEHGEWQSV